MQNPNAGLTGGYSIPKHNDDDDDDDDDDFGYIWDQSWLRRIQSDQLFTLCLL